MSCQEVDDDEASDTSSNYYDVNESDLIDDSELQATTPGIHVYEVSEARKSQGRLQTVSRVCRITPVPESCVLCAQERFTKRAIAKKRALAGTDDYCIADAKPAEADEVQPSASVFELDWILTYTISPDLTFEVTCR